MISFESTTVTSTFLDPKVDYAEVSIDLEHRRDPLTGRHARIAHYIQPREKTELRQVVVDSAIPIFAPPLVEEVTPRYPSDLVEGGRMHRGASVLFPNLNPYDEYSPVVAIGGRPLVLPGELSAADVGDALCLVRDFFDRLPEDRRVGVIGWNYLPESSSSIPHPHLQAAATTRVPDRLAEEYAGEAAFRAAHGADFWTEFIESERGGDRWLDAVDGWNRVVAFAPRAPIPETMIVSDEIPGLGEAADGELLALAARITELATAYHELGYSSFNLLIHPTAGVDGSRLRARYVPRTFVVPKLSSSDWSWVHVGTEEGLCMISPEAFAADLRGRLD